MSSFQCPNGKQLLLISADTARKLSAPDVTPIGVSYRDASPSEASTRHAPDQSLRQDSFNTGPSQDADDYMPLDDTADRIWVHDLDAEIAAIEAEEAKQNGGIQLSEAGKEYSKIPEHLLKQGGSAPDRAANMQMILYRDPISISVPEEDDAVRKTIIEARRRMREKQAEEREALHSVTVQDVPEPSHVDHGYDVGDLDEDGMDLD